jgi:hypothetical protein
VKAPFRPTSTYPPDVFTTCSDKIEDKFSPTSHELILESNPVHNKTFSSERNGQLTKHYHTHIGNFDDGFLDMLDDPIHYRSGFTPATNTTFHQSPPIDPLETHTDDASDSLEAVKALLDSSPIFNSTFQEPIMNSSTSPQRKNRKLIAFDSHQNMHGDDDEFIPKISKPRFQPQSWQSDRKMKNNF